MGVAERVDRLEEALTAFVRDVGIEFNKVYNAQLRTESELQVFKDEMREFKDEMRVFKNEMGEFKGEMGSFKDEMRALAERSERERREEKREMNRRWGELANKLGTMVEDLVYPSLPRIVKETLGVEVDDLMIRRKRRFADGRRFEYDAIALAGELVVLNSTKASLRSADVDRFVEDIGRFREVFPEYAHRPLIGALASLAVDEDVLSYAGKRGFLVLAVGDEIMEVKNPPGFVPGRW